MSVADQPPAIVALDGHPVALSVDGRAVLRQTTPQGNPRLHLWTCGGISQLAPGWGIALSGDGTRYIVDQSGTKRVMSVQGGAPLSGAGDWRVLSPDGSRAWAFQSVMSPPSLAVAGLSGGQPPLSYMPLPNGTQSAVLSQPTGSGGSIECAGELTGNWGGYSAPFIVRGGAAEFLPRLFGTGAYVRAVSPNGRFIAGNVADSPNGVIRWEVDNGIEVEYLGVPFSPGGVAKGIANDGTVVGSLGLVAVLWDASGEVHDLRQWLDARGVDVSRHYFEVAYAISGDGRVILATGYGDSGQGGFVILLDGSTCPGDVGGAGGEPGADCRLDNNDFVAFIDGFFAGASFADRGGTGGSAVPDGAYDNNDFVVFVDQFFAGCP